MLIHPLRTWLVVVRGHQEERIRLGLLRSGGKFDRLGRAVRSRARHHLRPLAGKLHRQLNHPDMLLHVQRGRLPRRPDRHDALDPRRHLPLDQRLKRLHVHLPMTEGSDQRGIGSFKHGRLLHRRSAPGLGG